MKPREFMTFGALFYLFLSAIYKALRLIQTKGYSHRSEKIFLYL